jgi:hypothetical protein
VSTLERLERIAQRLEEASELAAPSRSAEYLAGAAAVRLEICAERRVAPLNWERLRAVELAAERLADSAPSDSEEQYLADCASSRLEGLREGIGS